MVVCVWALLCRLVVVLEQGWMVFVKPFQDSQNDGFSYKFSLVGYVIFLAITFQSL